MGPALTRRRRPYRPLRTPRAPKPLHGLCSRLHRRNSSEESEDAGCGDRDGIHKLSQVFGIELARTQTRFISMSNKKLGFLRRARAGRRAPGAPLAAVSHIILLLARMPSTLLLCHLLHLLILCTRVIDGTIRSSPPLSVADSAQVISISIKETASGVQYSSFILYDILQGLGSI